MKISLLLISAFLLFSFSSNAQISKETKKKLKDLKGDIEKITIKTDKGELTVEGDDAEALYYLMKQPVYFESPMLMPPVIPMPHLKKFNFEFLDDDLLMDEDEDVILESPDSSKNIKVFVSKDGRDKKKVKMIIKSDSLETVQEEEIPEGENGQVIIKKDGDKEIIIKKHIKKEETEKK